MDVRSSIEDLDEVTKQISVQIPAERVDQEIEGALNNMSRTVRMKGFRPGKAPRQLVEKMHGERVKHEVAQRLISNSLYEVVRENKIQVVGNPQLEVPSIEAGKELSFTAKISVYPTPAISGYDDFEITVPKRIVDDAALERVTASILASKATVKKIEIRDEVREGDVVDLMLTIEVEGDENNRPEPVSIVIGEHKLPKEIETALVGAKVTEAREAEVTIDESHAAASIRGKKVVYKATVVNISERILPELTDELVKELGGPAQTVDELKTYVRGELEKDSERQAKADARAAAIEHLLGKNEFTVPRVMVEEEIRSLIARSGLIEPGAIESGKIDLQSIPVEPFEPQYGEPATKRVKSAIIVDRVGDIEGIVASREDEEKACEEIAQESNIPVDSVLAFFREKKRYSGFMLEVTRNKILDFLVSRAKITYTEKAAE